MRQPRDKCETEAQQNETKRDKAKPKYEEKQDKTLRDKSFYNTILGFNIHKSTHYEIKNVFQIQFWVSQHTKENTFQDKSFFNTILGHKTGNNISTHKDDE